MTKLMTTTTKSKLRLLDWRDLVHRLGQMNTSAESERRALDHYETPPHYVRALLDNIGQHAIATRVIYEPCVGRGHISKLLVDAGAGMVFTNDINPDCIGTTHHDATRNVAWRRRRKYDWTITNGPFNRLAPILRRALAHSHNVAFLCRLSFLEPTLSRRKFWTDIQLEYGPPSIIVLPRYSFRRNRKGKRQTDSVTCCWIVWRVGAKPRVQISLVERAA